jgi:hypothetical protein
VFKYMLSLVFVVGMIGSSPVAFSGANHTFLGCEATIKCVCESKFSGATRVVPCPSKFDSPPFFPGHGPWGTLGVACSAPLFDSEHAICEDLDIRCHWWLG